MQPGVPRLIDRASYSVLIRSVLVRCPLIRSVLVDSVLIRCHRAIIGR